MKSKIVIWTDNLDDAEKVWHSLMDLGWDVLSPIEVKFNWSKFRSMYRVELVK